MNIRVLSAGVLICLITPAALAHEGHTAASLSHGLIHPLGGVDHLLVMLAVGVWAAQYGGRIRWFMPLAFLALMALGALGTGLLGGATLLEPGIAGSVLLLGLLVAVGCVLPPAGATAICGLFALFHGAAHGAEMGPGSNVWLYGAGFLLSTAGLHLAGLYAADRASRSDLGTRAVRVCGLAAAGVGALLLAA